MKHLTSRLGRTRATVFLTTLSLITLTSPSMGQAQTTNITSSGLNTVIRASGTTTLIDGGTRPTSATGNPNLFHSFGNFSVGTGETALFRNLDATGTAGTGYTGTTTNIFGRVTGGNVSAIFGAIDTVSQFPQANFWLINPAGVLFGPNAALNVGGSITITTADYLKLADSNRFFADPVQTTILSIAPVASFGFIKNPSGVIALSSGTTLAASPGQALSLIGISPAKFHVAGSSDFLNEDSGISHISLSAPGGQVNLLTPGNLIDSTTAGELQISPPGQAFAMSSTNLVHSDAIRIAGGPETFLKTSTTTFGSHKLMLRGDQIMWDRGSTDSGRVEMQTPESGSIQLTGEGTLNATGTLFEGDGGFLMQTGSLIINQGLGFGDSSIRIAGDTVLTASRSITLAENGSISSGIGTGSTSNDAGILTIKAPDIRFVRSDSFAGLFTPQILVNAIQGTTGRITIQGTNIELINSYLHMGGAGSSRPGFLKIVGLNGVDQAESFSLNRGSTIVSGDPNGSAGSPILIQAKLTDLKGKISAQAAFGNGGDVSISGTSVTLDGATLTTNSSGNFGRIIDTSRFDPNGTGTLTGIRAIPDGTGRFYGVGDAGAVSIEATQSINLFNGATIESLSTGMGNAGPIRMAAPHINISGLATELNASTTLPELQVIQGGPALPPPQGGQIIISGHSSLTIDGASVSASTTGVGSGGAIKILGGHTQIQHQAIIKTSSIPDPLQSVLVPGNAGEIDLISNSDLIIRDSRISSQADQASGSNIKLTAPNIIRIVDSTISSSVQGQAGSNGGNITIDPQLVVIQNSNLLANANAGTGGNITVIASGAVLVDPNSQLNASAGPAGVSGSVNINTPVQVIGGALVPLKTAYTQAGLSGDRCAADPKGQFSSFVQTGRDGVPHVPGALSPSPLGFLDALQTPALGSSLGAITQEARLGLIDLLGSDSSLVRFHSGCRS